MRWNEPDDQMREDEGAPGEITFADVIDSAARKIVTAIVIAGGLIALALYFQPSPPRYQVSAGADGRFVRIDTKRGTVIACDNGPCYRVLRRGQELDDPPARKALPAPAARESQPAPAPPTNVAAPAR